MAPYSNRSQVVSRRNSGSSIGNWRGAARQFAIKAGQQLARMAVSEVSRRFSTPSIPSTSGGYRTSSVTSSRRVSTTPSMNIDFTPRSRPSIPVRVKGTATGRYRGRFATKRKSKSVPILSKLQRRGFSVTTERYGVLKDPHCAYIAHSTAHTSNIAISIKGAMFRMVLEKAGITVPNTDQVLPLSKGVNGGTYESDGWKVSYTVFQQLNQDYQTYEYVIPTATTFDGLMADTPGITGAIESEILNQPGTHTPYSISLEIGDISGSTTSWRSKAIIYLDHCTTTLWSQSTLTLQNRTSGALASGAALGDLERVDNQPLQGFMYKFKNADPRMKTPISRQGVSGAIPQLGLFNTANINGLALIRSASLPITFQEPPVPSLFKNINGYSKVSLQPGDMKKSVCSHKMSMNHGTLAKKLRVENIGVIDGITRVTGMPGACHMFGLEERLRTTTENPITISYELESVVGCMMKEKKQYNVLQTRLNIVEQSLTS